MHACRKDTLHLAAGEGFPQVGFRFTVRSESGRAEVEAPLLYRDRVHQRYVCKETDEALGTPVEGFEKARGSFGT